MTFKTMLAAVIATIGLSAQIAAAAPLDVTLETSTGNIIDSFTLAATGQQDSVGSNYVLYSITNDLHGYNGVFFGDNAVNGWFGIGTITNGYVAQQINEYFSPALYSGSGLVANLSAGQSYIANNGDVLKVAAVPEPATTMLIGASLVAMMIAARRRRS